MIIDLDLKQGEDVGDQNFGNISVEVGCPRYEAIEECDGNNDLFTFDIKLNQQSLARSNFGPVMVSEELSEVSLYLAGPRIITYGMEGLVWNNERHVTQYHFNQHSSVHLPLVIGMLPNMAWYLLYLDTNRPGEMVVNTGTDMRPVVTWRTMGGPLKLHVLTAESLPALLKKQSELRSEAVVSPGHWSLGYQLCRDSGHPREFKLDVEGMLNANIPLQFDGDCIDQQLVKDAFSLNTESFQSSLTNQASLLTENKKYFSLPLVTQRLYNDKTGQTDGCLEDSTSSSCYAGKLKGEVVMYPDMNWNQWMAPQLEDLTQQLNTYSLTAQGRY